MVYDEYGSDDVLSLRELPDPKVAPGEVRIRVRRAGVNPVDWKVMSGGLDGIMDAVFPIIPGWDVAGTVESVGIDTPEFEVGDDVVAYARRDAIHGGTFAYFLNRNALDQYASSAVSSDVVYRAAFGAVPGTTLSEGGVAGANPADHTPPWAGYGDEVAITPTGSYIFISGNNDIDVNAEFLQVSTGGAFLHFADGTGFLNATDVDASATLVGFKTGSGETTTLGYIVLP